MDAVNELAHFSRINKERLASAFSKAIRRGISCVLDRARGFGFDQEPEADGNLRAVEELAGVELFLEERRRAMGTRGFIRQTRAFPAKSAARTAQRAVPTLGRPLSYESSV